MSEFLHYFNGVPQYIFWGSFGTAIALLFVLQGRTPSESIKRFDGVIIWAFILACYGACVGISAMLIVYFFGINQWLAPLPGLLLGIVVMYAMIQMAEHS